MASRKTVKAEAIVTAEKDPAAVIWEDFPETSRNSFCRGFLKWGYEMFAKEEIQEEYQQWLKTKKKSIPADQAKERSSSGY